MSDEISPLTQSILAELKALNATISGNVAARSKAKKVTADLIKGVESGDVGLIVKTLSKKSQPLIELYPEARPVLEKLQFDLRRRQEEEARHLVELLKDYCQTEGIAVRGNPPRLVVDHLVDIEFEFRKARAKVGNQSLNTLKWDPVREALEIERTRLWRRAFNPQAFRDRLVQTYWDLERTKPSATGWAALNDVYQLLKQQHEKDDPHWKRGGRLVAYYKDEFGADLSRLLQAQASHTIELPHIELSAIRDPRRAFRVLRPDRNVDEYGFMKPKEA